MNPIVRTITLPEPPFDEREALRYAGCRGGNPHEEEIPALLRRCFAEIRPQLTYRVCWMELDAVICEDCCDFGLLSLKSRSLAKNLAGCGRVLIFGATIGVAIDRAIARFGRISPVRALLLQAIGAERIEALCDAFCEGREAQEGIALRPRFSPGYGDLPLEAQREIFALLDCPRQIGLTLNDSLLMSPSKSVTAIAGWTSRHPENS